MKIILLEDVRRLGSQGDLVEVKDGYGRNYLIPKKLALPANQKNLKKLSQLKKEKESRKEKEMKDLSKIKEKIKGLSLTVTAEAQEDETLYGAITDKQIQALLKQEQIEVAKDKIVLEEPIKKLGVYKIKVKISNDLESDFRLWVVKK